MKVKTTDTGERPGTGHGICAYCKEPIGSHKSDCVIPSRTVVVRTTVEHIVSVPEGWTTDNIEFHFNEGSSCVSSIFDGLSAPPDGKSCACGRTVVEVLREASEQDHAHLIWANKQSTNSVGRESE